MPIIDFLSGIEYGHGHHRARARATDDADAVRFKPMSISPPRMADNMRRVSVEFIYRRLRLRLTWDANI